VGTKKGNEETGKKKKERKSEGPEETPAAGGAGKGNNAVCEKGWGQDSFVGRSRVVRGKTVQEAKGGVREKG